MYSTTSILAMLGIVLLLAAGCKKIPDYPHGSRPCQIIKMKGSLKGNEDSLIFKYNSKGLPVSITQIHASTGSPDYMFRYDKRDRLKDFIGVYTGSNAFEFWHRYGHDHKNRIITDTLYIMGIIADEPEAYIETTAIFEYDAQNRIIRTILKYTHNQDEISWGYSYDQQGNRQSGGDWPVIAYDNKVNLHRLHPVWQFLDNDYSNNNPIVADAYNEYRLPLKYNIAGTDLTQYFSFVGFQFPRVDITYTCR